MGGRRALSLVAEGLGDSASQRDGRELVGDWTRVRPGRAKAGSSDSSRRGCVWETAARLLGATAAGGCRARGLRERQQPEGLRVGDSSEAARGYSSRGLQSKRATGATAAGGAACGRQQRGC
ncbi:unnamed protein product [Lampetra planeri]